MNEAVELLRELIDVGLTTSLTNRARAVIAAHAASAPSVAAVTLKDWTFKDFQDGKLLAQQADGSGAVVTDNPSDGIAQCILARLIKDLLAQRAGTGAVRQYTYASTQTTKCAACGEHKHTPLRIDWMGGYVCLTCIDHELEFREDAASAGDDGDAALLDAAKALVGGAMKTITGIYEVSGSDLMKLRDALRAMEAAKS